MFLFLSKLLPLFLYPLGLACMLMLVTIVLLWRRSRLTILPLLLAFLILTVSSSAWASDALVRSLEAQNLGSGELPTVDAIVVLGGGTRPPLPPRPWVEVNEAGDRILYAAQLFKQGKAPRLILSGGRIDWQDGGPPESADMAELAQAMGVPKSAILQDSTSLNTRQNAVNVKQIMNNVGIRRILLVTSAMHMPRSLAIFQRLGIEAVAAPTDFITVQENGQTVSSESAMLRSLPDTDNLHHLTRALKEYVGLWVYRLRGWA